MAIFCSAILVLVADQLSKAWIRSNFAGDRIKVVIGGVLNITYLSNRGGAFGLFPSRQPVFIILTLVTIAGIVYFYRAYAPRFLACRIAVGMILGGAVGNLLDRLALDSRGGVTDWIDLHWGRYHWPAFNVADSAITIGVLILMYLLLIKLGDCQGNGSRQSPLPG